MTHQSFTGISFPFRIGTKGGVVMSTTSVSDVQHIIEAMEQILLTRPMERGMEFQFKSDIDSNIFEPGSESTKTLIAYQVEEALRELEDRVSVRNVSIVAQDSTLYANITFTVPVYNTLYTTTLKVGEFNVQNTD